MAKKQTQYISSKEFITLVKQNKNPKIREQLLKLRESSRKAELKGKIQGLRRSEAYRNAPISSSLQSVGQVQAQAVQSQRKFQMLGSRAERIENYLTSINEVPFLHTMEKERGKQCTPPDKWILNIERNAALSMPD
jgi:hypothetical protein